MTASIVCVHCRKPCTTRFEITRFDAAGVAHGPIMACSISCLITWAYEYAVLSGTSLAYRLKHNVLGLLDSLRGKA